MALDPLSIEVDIGAEDVASEHVLDHKSRDVALAATRVLGCPSIVFLGRVETPGRAYRLLEVRESDHRTTLAERKTPSIKPASLCASAERAGIESRLPRRELRAFHAYGTKTYMSTPKQGEHDHDQGPGQDCEPVRHGARWF